MDAALRLFDDEDLPAACRMCPVREHGLCQSISAAQLSDLHRYAIKRRAIAGSEICSQGETTSFYANIISGVVKLSKTMRDGRQQIVGLQFTNDFLGQPFAVESATTIEAATDTEICSLPRAVLDRLAATTPALERRMHQQAADDLNEARDWMVTLGRKTAREKVANLLYMVGARELATRAEKTAFDLPLSRADIADYLGLTIETVSRQITKLKIDGLIAMSNNRNVSVPDMNRLAEAAGI